MGLAKKSLLIKDLSNMVHKIFQMQRSPIIRDREVYIQNVWIAVINCTLNAVVGNQIQKPLTPTTYTVKNFHCLFFKINYKTLIPRNKLSLSF